MRIPQIKTGLKRERWYEWRDSNSHGLPHWNLNPARLPVPPHSHILVGRVGIEPTTY